MALLHHILRRKTGVGEEEEERHLRSVSVEWGLPCAERRARRALLLLLLLCGRRETNVFAQPKGTRSGAAATCEHACFLVAALAQSLVKYTETRAEDGLDGRKKRREEEE